MMFLRTTLSSSSSSPPSAPLTIEAAQEIVHGHEPRVDGILKLPEITTTSPASPNSPSSPPSDISDSVSIADSCCDSTRGSNSVHFSDENSNRSLSSPRPSLTNGSIDGDEEDDGSGVSPRNEPVSTPRSNSKKDKKKKDNNNDAEKVDSSSASSSLLSANEEPVVKRRSHKGRKALQRPLSVPSSMFGSSKSSSSLPRFGGIQYYVHQFIAQCLDTVRNRRIQFKDNLASFP